MAVLSLGMMTATFLCHEKTGQSGQWEDFIEFENEYNDQLRDCFIHERAITWGSIYRSAL